jgi:hypothetical protein
MSRSGLLGMKNISDKTFKAVVNYTKVKRLAWAGHLVRMNNDRTLTKIFSTKPNGVKRAGRPKLRWEDGVDQDVRISEVKNWKKFALTETNGQSFLTLSSPVMPCGIILFICP